MAYEKLPLVRDEGILMLDSESRWKDFPSLANRTYLNTAAEGIPPLAVIKALEQYGQDKLLGMDGRLLHADQWNQAKSKVGQLFGLEAKDIGICSCSSEAYNLANLALRLKEGDEVIINDLDFPAGATPWLNDTSPAQVKVWRSKQGVLHTEDLSKLLSSKTRLVNTSLVSFYNGYRVDVEEISGVIRERSGAMLAVDVTQGLARIPLDVRKADLVISSTHKWLLGSHGGGLVGVMPERADEWTVPAGGWFNLEDPFGPTRLEKITIKKGPESFMLGMPNYPAIYAINAALGYILNIGVESIHEYAKGLVKMCLEGVEDLPVEVLGPFSPDRPSGIIAFRHPDYENIGKELHKEKIHVMTQAGRIRVSIHGYNTESDVRRFLEILGRVLQVRNR